MILEHLFDDFHGKDSINKEPKVMTKVNNLLVHELQKENLHLPVKVVECLVRTRTFIRLNYLNKIILSWMAKLRHACHLWHICCYGMAH